MDDLIRLLLNLVFDNPIVAVIAFGIVSFLLNKLRSAGAQQSAPPRGGMPPFGGQGPLPARGDMSRGQPAGRRSAEPVGETASAASTPAPAAVEPAVAPPATRKPRTAPAPTVSAAAKPTRAAPSLHARNAVQGMIWSEIYGPPRAVRPHRSIKR